MKLKITIEYIIDWLKNNGCKYITGEYKNKYSIIKFVALCGHEKELSWFDIKYRLQYKNCKKCGYKNRNNRNININDIKNLLKNNNCILISDAINSCFDTIKYIAQCGHSYQCVYTHFQQGNGRICRSCSMKKNHIKCQIKNQKEIKERFLKRGCILLSLYTGARNNVLYIACCGHKNNIIASNFFIGLGNICKHCFFSNRKSTKSDKWIDYICKINNIIIEKEFHIPNTRYVADGYCKENNTVYEFYGDLWHGNPNKFTLDYVNYVDGNTCEFLYNRTKKRESTIKSLGYNIISIWESEWEKIKGKVIENATD